MFSVIIQDHFYNPRNCEPLAVVTHSGTAGIPGDGPYMVLDFEVVDGVVQHTFYRTYGCPSAVACGSIIAELAIGRAVETVLKMTVKDIDLLLGGLLPEKRHCAELAIKALNLALEREIPV